MAGRFTESLRMLKADNRTLLNMVSELRTDFFFQEEQATTEHPLMCKAVYAICTQLMRNIL